jgi:YfiH family protein
MLERRLLDGGMAALVSSSLLAEGFLVAFTERAGGVSQGVFRSLNMGYGSGDEPEAVLENRRRVCRTLGIERFAAARQVHGAARVPVGRALAGDGFDVPGRWAGTGDVLVARDRETAVAVLVADCVPVALADPCGILAVVHAGWRGVAAGVLASALEPFPSMAGVRAVVGPAVRADHYEVGEEVVSAVARAPGGGSDPAVDRRTGRTRLDLPDTVVRILRAHGVRRFERAEECTACEGERFFSYRRDGRSGRQALVAVRL